MSTSESTGAPTSEASSDGAAAARNKPDLAPTPGVRFPPVEGAEETSLELLTQQVAEESQERVVRTLSYTDRSDTLSGLTPSMTKVELALPGDGAARQIQGLFDASPLAVDPHPKDWRKPIPIGTRAVEAASLRAGLMLNFCERPRLGSDRKAKRKNPATNGKRKSSSAHKASPSIIRGRLRRTKQRGELFLSTRDMSVQERVDAHKPSNLDMGTIKEWFEDIPEEFRLCELGSTRGARKEAELSASSRKKRKKKKKSARNQSHRRPTSLQTPSGDTSFMQNLVALDEARFQSMRTSSEWKKKVRKMERRAEISPGQIPVMPYSQGPEPHVTVMSDLDPLGRAGAPRRAPAELQKFWKRHHKTGTASKILSDSYTLSSFEVPTSELDLPVSREMMDLVKQRILNQQRKSIWTDFWTDDVGSELARPKSASIFVSEHGVGSDSVVGEAPAFTIDSSAALARLPHAGRRFDYVHKAHIAAGRLQRVWRLRVLRKQIAATRIQSLVRAHAVRRRASEQAALRQDCATLLAAVIRGHRDRRFVAFLRNVAWNRASVLCQRGARRWLARRRVRRMRAEMRRHGATSMQRVWRGIWGRQIARRCWEARRQRCARKVQNVARWYNFRRAHENYRFMFVTDVEDCQRTVRGFMGRRRFRRRARRWAAARQIQRVARGRFGRLRFDRKMALVRAACVTIQVRARGMRDRELAMQKRAGLIEAERERTKLEDLACLRALRRADDLMMTRAGKLEYKKAKDAVRAQLRSMRTAVSLGPTKQMLQRLRAAFRRADTRVCGYVDREQFVRLMAMVRVDVSESQVDSMFAETGGPHGGRGGYRLCDGADQRDFSEVAEWFMRDGAAMQTGGLKGLSLRVRNACASLGGANVRQLARIKVYHRIRTECLEKFRAERGPPFACPDCHKRFLFSYELERHRNIPALPTAEQHSSGSGRRTRRKRKSEAAASASAGVGTGERLPIAEAGECSGLYWCEQLGPANVLV